MSAKRAVAKWAIVVMGAAIGAAGCGTSGNPVPSNDPAALAGEAKFNQSCAGCHNASSIRRSASLITNNMGTLSSRMSGITLTDEEVADLQAYLATQ